eukprot:TRINITY_DN3518_c0_g2_i1.p1 TRINITY_DN3518_c0_g2~~TRINITY_DN3518_c0_g2_i1.p1  ORF type:complete len:652 (-),score=153.40 TRINITY_DN3518_c0_g2_i1:156-2051(-)
MLAQLTYLTDGADTEKETEDGASKRDVGVSYGVCGMQGWRRNMEDAHLAIADYEDERDISLFGVFDGHGGKGVSKFAAAHFPELLKSRDAFKRGDFKTALEEAFLEVDVRLRSPEGREEVIKLDKADPGKKVRPVYLPKLLVRALLNQNGGNVGLKAEFGDDDEDIEPESPHESQETSSAKSVARAEAEDNMGGGDQQTQTEEPQGTESEKVQVAQPNGCDHEDGASVIGAPNGKGTEDVIVDATRDQVCIQAPAVACTSGGERPGVVCASAPKDGPASDPVDGAVVVPSEEGGAGSEATGQATNLGDDDDDGSDHMMALAEEDLEEEVVLHRDEDDEEFSWDEDEDIVAVDPAILAREATPEAQGCTAVVVMVVRSPEGEGPRLICANAGDSRAIVSRRGAVIALSEDHKPECAQEVARINKAGGYVQMNTPGGPRVMGDLNLSRAFGDTRYKASENLPAKEQVVTAFPEVRTLPLKEEDEFIVIGCDGIWETLSNQEAVNFVRPRLLEREDCSKPEVLSRTCAAICDRGLCPSMDATENPGFDGHGCDNMTVVVVKLKQTISGAVDDDATTAAREAEKRAAESAASDEPPAKKQKLDASAEKSTEVEVEGEIESNGDVAPASDGAAQSA